MNEVAIKMIRFLALGLFTVALAGPPEAESCGPVFPQAQFHFVAQPPEAELLRGNLGIIRPTYYSRYLFIAYRYLSAIPLSQEETDAFSESSSTGAPSDENMALAQWLDARSQVPDIDPPAGIDVFRRYGQFEVYRNCLDAAFTKAAATLHDRKGQWGIGDPKILDWVRGQDAVFSNCSADGSTPGPLPEGSDRLLRADRQYQIAAARFYAQDYAAAEQGFQAIANDLDSPWHDVAPYLSARALVRHWTIGGDRSKLDEAEQVLRTIQGKWREPAQKLLHHVQAIADPAGRWVELCQELMQPDSSSDFAQNLSDLAQIPHEGARISDQNNDLANWILAFQRHDWQFALGRWRASHSQHWLLASLAAIPKDSPDAPALLDQARGVPVTSPAWTSIASYAIALETARAQSTAARRWADQALSRAQSADRNAFLAERLRLANSWTEFLRFAPRQPVALTVYDTDQNLDQQSTLPMFDSDVTEPMNQEVPLSRWVDAAANRLVPARLQTQIAQAGWVRAVILGRANETRSFASRLVELNPDLSLGMTTLLTETDPDRAHFAAVVLILHNPGLQPVLRSGLGRETPVANLENFRDNWWNIAPPEHPQTQPVTPAETHAWGLPPGDRALGAKEWGKLKDAAPAGPDYLAAETIRWAQAHADDPRIPEALHLSVRAIRFGAGGPRNPAVSRQAFRLLHSRYPKSPWTAQTPYWY